jgi:hypothetical protein
LDDIKDKLKEMVQSEGDFISNPAAIKRLKEKGVPFEESEDITPEQFIEQLFDVRKLAALEVIKKLPSYPRIASPSVISLYKEISECIFFGLNGAAITLSGILVEYVLKFAAYKIEMGGFAKYDPEKWDEFEKLDFSKAIWRANKNGLLTKEERKKLHLFREHYRNPYNHYNIKKITERYGFRNVSRLNIETLDIEVLDIAAKDNPVIQAHAKPFVDAETVLDVFAFADSVVKLMFSKIDHPQQSALPKDKT